MLEAVRLKAIEANPKVEKEQMAINGFFNNLDGLPCDPEEAFGEIPDFKRAIRLADVLLATRVAERMFLNGELIDVLRAWDLRQDDLDLQSDETVEFTYGLIK